MKIKFFIFLCVLASEKHEQTYVKTRAGIDVMRLKAEVFMVYAAVLAGGSGLRMGGNIPKQFMSVSGKPIIIMSIEAFIKSGSVDKVYVCVSHDYLNYTHSLVKKFLGGNEVQILEGGKNRNETLFNVLKKIKGEGISDDDIILTHDAVRPFIDKRIIDENISAAKKYGACNTVCPAVDTVIYSADGRFIDAVPVRSSVYHAQTPQSFNAAKLYNYYSLMTAEEFEKYTDACTVFTENGERVFLVRGSRDNIKITYPEDMEKAESIVGKLGK